MFSEEEGDTFELMKDEIVMRKVVSICWVEVVSF